MVKIGVRRPSIKKRVAARTSVKRIIRHQMGLKAPRGMGWATNPRKAAYNRIYHRTTKGCLTFALAFAGLMMAAAFAVAGALRG